MYKKRVLLVVVLIIGTVAMIYSNSNTIKLKMTEIKQIDTIDGFNMTVISKSRSSISLLVANETDTRYEYGSKYDLEKYVNDKWYRLIPKGTFVTMEAYTIEPHEENKIEVNLRKAYGLIQRGDYRVIKKFDVKDQEGQYKTYTLATYFLL